MVYLWRIVKMTKRKYFACSTCGKNIRLEDVSTGYHPEYGKTFSWQCPHCNTIDGSP